MTFGAPLGFLALAAIPALVAAYFLRRRQPPRVVSALFLWRTPDQRAEAGPRLQRFSREVSLALEILAVCFAALFLADARCGEAAHKSHVVIIVDGSLSMVAEVEGKTTSERVKDAVAKLARDEGAGVLTIVESGVRPRLIAGPQLETARALSALESWQPAQPAHDLSSAVVMARELSGSTERRIHLFTDGPLPGSVALPPQVEGRSLGRSADNTALLTAQRHDEGGVASVTVRVGHFGAKAVKVPVRFTAPDDAPQTQVLELQPGGSAVLRVGLKTNQPVTVSLPDDALTADGRVTLLPSPLADVPVGLFEGLDGPALAAVKRFLAVAPGVTVAEPALLSIGPPDTRARLTLGVKGATKSFIGPFFAQKAHPLLDDVMLGGAVWTAGENPPGRALLSAGAVVLMSEEDDGTVHLNLDVGKSNVQRTVAWPVLLGNVVRQARLGKPGFPRRHLMLGEDVPVVTTPGSTWLVKSPAGEERAVLGVGALTLPALPAPGRWELLKDGERFDSLEVLPLDPRESDLRDRGAWEVKSTSQAGIASLATVTPRAFWPLLVLLALLLVDFWVTARVPKSPLPQGRGPGRGATVS
ncbi:MAG: BatA and WFA domain-containing protein [Myxococcota bacterium]